MRIYPGQSSAEALAARQAQRARQVRTVSTLRSGASSTVNVARASESKPDVNLGGSGQEALR